MGSLATARCPLAADGMIQFSERKEMRREVMVAGEVAVVALAKEVAVVAPE